MLTLATASFSQETIKIANIVELSGGGATAGANFKNGVELAVKEINAAGGILGKKIQTTTSDTQNADGVFVNSNEEESARILRELRKQGWTKPIIGETTLKAAIDKVGKLDRKAVAAAMHTLKVSTAKEPGVLMDVSFDANGDLDRDSFLVEVKNGKQEVVATLPPLGAAAAPAAKK